MAAKKRKQEKSKVPARCDGAGEASKGCAAWSEDLQACMCLLEPGVCLVTKQQFDDVRAFFPRRKA